MILSEDEAIRAQLLMKLRIASVVLPCREGLLAMTEKRIDAVERFRT
jgi:hypothetical protein